MYKCPEGHEYSESRSIKQDLTIDGCPECGAPLSQVYNPPLIQLKGGGFYKNART
jgi:predicted nucleic acid-binding Zn ribbon protein